MDKNFVVESRLLTRDTVQVPGGGQYAECTVACDAPSFEPGQYLMVRLDGPGVNWPYPYVISGTAPGGYRILASAEQPLAHCEAGAAVQYWGPRGSGAAAPGEALLLVAQPETAFLLSPFAGRDAEWLLLGSKTADGTRAVPGAEELARAIEAEPDRKVLIALNPDELLALDAALPEDARARCLLFVSNKKACGFDACKGCYLHSSTDSFGVNVCCKGPFMPWQIVDLAQDIKCFETFNSQEVPV